MNKIEFNGDTYECNVDPEQLPSIERMLTGTTQTDKHIHSLAIPNHPIRLRLAVKLLRWYRRMIAPKLGNRCVFEPSCSHYSELAIRQEGLIKGIIMTIKRLRRCRTGNGGMDMP